MAFIKDISSTLILCAAVLALLLLAVPVPAHASKDDMSDTGAVKLLQTSVAEGAAVVSVSGEKPKLVRRGDEVTPGLRVKRVEDGRLILLHITPTGPETIAITLTAVGQEVTRMRGMPEQGALPHKPKTTVQNR